MSVGEMSVGEVAARLGVAPSTLRMWGQRYGLTASNRSPGGHRRYSAGDLDRLTRMHAALITGTTPAAAALAILAAPSAGTAIGPAAGSAVRPAAPPATGQSLSSARARRPGGPGGAVLAVPGANGAARGLARAASRLDDRGATDTILRALREQQTLSVWNEIVAPVLVAAGAHWERTGSGIEVEHLLTQSVTLAFSEYSAELPKLAQVIPVLLAGAPQEEHILPLHAIRAALAERGVPARLLGPRTPIPVLARAARRTRAPGVLIWSSLQDPHAKVELASVAAAHRRLVLLVGGPGWDGLGALEPAIHCRGLAQALDLLTASWRER